ncbi:hypothetical protein CLU79DRAFT_97234 [Phycomyces nitens]|nr:hypothetical protein CLU79DRAFT_97234 [Phycomyces nitens]
MLPSYTGSMSIHSNDPSDSTSIGDASPSQDLGSQLASLVGLSSISVGEILEKYQNNVDLLKHILIAKTQEDKRRTAEELRLAEEARLQNKYLDFEMNHHRRSRSEPSFSQDMHSESLDSLLLPNSSDIESSWLSSLQGGSDLSIMSPFGTGSSLQDFNNPPSPSHSILLPSPYMSFDMPFGNLSLSVASSPEPIELTQSLTMSPQAEEAHISSPVSSFPKTRSKRRSFTETLRPDSRSKMPGKSLRKPRKSATPPLEEEEDDKKDKEEKSPQSLDHNTVMEALRAKLRRSSQSPKTSKERTPPASSTSVLFLDLHSRRKTFPGRRNRSYQKDTSPLTYTHPHIHSPLYMYIHL